MNPYEIDIEKLKESEEIKDEKDFLKLKLVTEFLKIISTMKTDQVLFLTGLDKSDLSRLRSFNTERFTIDKIVGLIDALGFSTSVKVKLKKVS
ncbi:MAG: hypothetical protein A2381_11330 [Bdellovibrionales bacterium RIFOXYB1_FULL_37_110]|nr:MAG: hypothetical protein A2417_11635 [Bdellovibrionales bacterium RIFOXYC1_FULL_37_79]OFZ57284.1 MAG: hypothetical protein A2381_11330 [Bdellovibrionales bacterium RIFOXYB1_FULL_37_110]OFZ62180.1 MAG: hypothetical protein A2577_13880 [Bdellovibrionales bacterium RIFOXYD1_FULL_36_51]